MHADTSPRPTAPDPAGSAASTAAPRPRAPSAGHGGVGIFEPRRFERVVAGNIIPPTAWAALEEVDQLVEKVNALYEGAAAEIEQARKEGVAAGFAEGFARAQQQMAEQLASLNERRARVLGEAHGRITDLACAIVARLAPGFDANAVAPALVRDAVEAAQAEQFLLIRVHPSVRESVSAGLGAVRQAHPAVGVIELVDDESLDPLSCVVVSEAGQVRAGIAQQIEAIRTALARAHNEADGDAGE